jgi:four helix bundle protein
MISQMRRAASAIPANIAEGCGRHTDADRWYVSIAAGSAFELDYSLLLTKDLRFMDDAAYLALHTTVTELRRMLNALVQKLKPNR